ncbi:sugar phosphate isomerase/epimerase family protein [Arthrobacter wenxiniae]|jgi:sugar phosphate isomerase/epimerase|uniref:Sugar phosphate isomerase/epimerase n=1 Tax=Arthrobacter wenxiniae TaxID=2713570 RepID=A0A7Y7IJG2_9MICC|nr:sugar phosphate isomerase/epimerase [Arthrobacter wenxiniae]NVM96388.1 sugar phosphate isomerase/epimerase [Arthrobacter wenxiniae]
MTYSLQLYTVRKPLEEDLAGTIARVASIGYTNVEPYNFVATADQLAAALAANGLQAPSGHAPLLRADQDEIFTAANKLGIGTVIDPHVDSSQWSTEEDIKATAAALNAAALKGAGYGVRVGYHNHEFELEAQFDGRSGLEVLAENLSPEVVLEVDTYWAAVGGEDPVELLKRLGDRVRFIHIKDGPLTKVDKDQVAVGAGQVRVWDVIAAAPALEVGVVELDDFTGDIFDAVTDSLNYLKAGNK